MADWRQRVGMASFRGVKFHAPTSEQNTGRDNAPHEFPFSEDAPYIEDTGRIGEVLRFEGYVIGDDYLDQRDALVKALTTPGPGELVHPFYGTRRVQVGKISVRLSDEEGGMARFTIECSETLAEPANPTTAPDGGTAVANSAAALQTSATSVFNAAFSTASKIVDGVSAVLRGATAAMDNLTSKVSFVAQTAATLRSQAQAMASSAVGLASSPGDIVASAIGIFDSIKDAVLGAQNVTDPLGVFLGIYAFNAGPPIPQTTTARALEQVNVTATQLLFQRLALVNAALVAIEIPYASYDDAIAARTRITDLLDDQAEIAADDTYPLLQQLRADLVKAVPGDASDLPHLVSYTPPATLPSLALAYRLYGDVDSEADLLARNRIRHPGFVAGGVELEVLSNEE